VHARGLTRAVVARSVAPDDVPRHLAAGDVGLCFLGRHASKAASSPTKYGEYLAAGLPVVTNPWIGDAGTLASEVAWVLADDFTPTTYRAVAGRLAALLSRQSETRLAARELARREFSLETAVARYHDLYLNVLKR
jgi:glycosyltransferase involved in cell wall biosynthesis